MSELLQLHHLLPGFDGLVTDPTQSLVIPEPHELLYLCHNLLLVPAHLGDVPVILQTPELLVRISFKVRLSLAELLVDFPSDPWYPPERIICQLNIRNLDQHFDIDDAKINSSPQIFEKPILCCCQDSFLAVRI